VLKALLYNTIARFTLCPCELDWKSVGPAKCTCLPILPCTARERRGVRFTTGNGVERARQAHRGRTHCACYSQALHAKVLLQSCSSQVPTYAACRARAACESAGRV